jgi:metal-dependent amidase/aminoacylase/carboxypeptidase family protein
MAAPLSRPRCSVYIATSPRRLVVRRSPRLRAHEAIARAAGGLRRPSARGIRIAASPAGVAAPGRRRGERQPIPLQKGAEDFALYANRVPSLFFWVSITPSERSPLTAPTNHSPLFCVDEAGIALAAQALAAFAIDSLTSAAKP